MLTEERFEKILSILEKEGSASVSHLVKELHISESTIRRDLNSLDAKGLLKKVHGGAMQKKQQYQTVDDEVDLRKGRNVEQKKDVARYVRGLIEDTDVVYMDAGTTIDMMIEEGINTKALYVTNSISHAAKLSRLGCRAYLLGGEFKITTGAIVGDEAVLSIEKYNFTKGFFGANGVTVAQGFTTPEPKEALIKRKGMEHSKVAYVLTDSSKFDEISSITFGRLEDAVVITDHVPTEYKKYKNIKEVKK